VHHQLRTLGELSLVGPAGAIPLEEPRLAALLVMLAVSGSSGMSEDELLLNLCPDARREKARAELSRLVAALRAHLGSESSIRLDGGRWSLAPGILSLDVRVLDQPRDSAHDEFLAGFTLPDSPEFQDWLATARRRVEPIRLTETVAPRTRARRARLLAGLAAVVVLLSAAAYFARPRAMAGFAAGDPVILADVRNQTGDTIFDGALLSAATIGLQQSGRLRLYSRARLPEIYRLMELPNRDTALTFELAQEVAERDDVRFVLGLRIDREGEGYRVSAQLGDVHQRKVAVSSAFAEGRNGVIGALDRVLATVRRQLGESRAELAKRSAPLPRVTTSSLEALRSYAEGARAWDIGEFNLAAELWKRSIDLDTGFATAYVALGDYHYHHHLRQEGERYYREALRRADRLTERERLRLLEGWASRRGDLDSAVVVSRIIAERYPSAPSWANYGTRLMQAHRNAEAIAALEKALAFDSTSMSSASTWINLATVLSRLERNEAALAAYHRAGGVDSLALYRNNINNEYGGTLVRVGRLAEAESTFKRMAARPNVASRAAAYRSLGYLAWWRGRVEEAGGYFQRAVDAIAQVGSPLSVARNRLLLAATLRASGRTAAAGAQIDSVLVRLHEPSFEPRFLTLITSALLKSDRAAAVDSVLRVLRTRVDRQSDYDVAAEAFVTAAVHLTRQRFDSALWYVRRTDRLDQTVPTLALEAAAYRGSGATDSARAVLARILDEDGFGFEGQEDWMRAPLLLGDLQLAAGDTVAARRSYERLLAQWRDAPPALPDIAAARARLAEMANR
jgi:tetratricopeptide (TPR) repeat protein